MVIDQFIKMRRCRQVLRWHTERTIQHQNLADHQWGVAMLVDYMGGPSQAVKAALVHDCAEVELGDIPAPVKWQFGNLYAEKERTVEDNMGVHGGWAKHITVAEKVLVETADRMEALLFSFEEIQLGNQNMRAPFDKLVRKLAPNWRGIPTSGQVLIWYLMEETGYLEFNQDVVKIMEAPR